MEVDNLLNDIRNDSSQEDPYFMMGERQFCPCPRPYGRDLGGQQSGKNKGHQGELWEIIFTCCVLVGMFAALISDRFGTDSVMLTALTFFLASKIITIEEGLAGFSNEGLLTVLVLFVVAEGISRTGALDWYMGKLLGFPKSAASAQLRLMVPIAIVSAFLNNTPVVAVMIPIVQRWGKNIGVSPQQLLIPLSFASILGGTCTLIGTSTNLVVKGLLDKRYANDDSVNITLFSIGEFGVPVAMAGITYILLVSPFVLPGAKKGQDTDGVNLLEDPDDVLLGARLTQWSPAAGRSVKRSGLRDTGGIYLVSVHRYATGNVHRAVGQEFVLNTGDILYFTGLVEEFGSFCEEHGLEMITNEIEPNIQPPKSHVQGGTSGVGDGLSGEATLAQAVAHNDQSYGPSIAPLSTDATPLSTLYEDSTDVPDIPVEVGVTKESLVQADTAERLRSINRMTDMIRGISRDESGNIGLSPKRRQRADQSAGPPKIVVTIERDLVVVGVDSRDRAGLLLDISRGILRLNLQLHHTEAAVVDGRSLSIWRCEPIGTELTDVEEVWSVLTALLEVDHGILAVKKRGLRVIRARVTPVSRLIGRRAADMDFRKTYKAAIVAVQRGGKNINQKLSTVVFEAGDSLIVQASDDSPLLGLKPPTKDFYKKIADEATLTTSKMHRSNSSKSFVNLVKLPSLSRRPSRDNEYEQGSDNNMQPNEHTTPGDTEFHSSSAPQPGQHGNNGDLESAQSEQMVKMCFLWQ